MAADFEVADISLALISRGVGGWVGGRVGAVLFGETLEAFWDGQLLCQHNFLAGCWSLFRQLALF